MQDIVVIGAGQAGAALVAKLRAEGYDGRLTLVGEEPAPPYQRPPLSKGYLLGKLERDRLFLRPESYYADKDIDLRMSTRVVTIDREARHVVLEDGERLPYDALALTTGSTPKTLPEAMGGRIPGVLTMRSLADADALAQALRPGGHLLVVGGGYIGLEAAAVARTLGMDVTLLEAGARILGRVACEETSEYVRKLHKDAGVHILENAGLDRLYEEAGRVAGARIVSGNELADATEIPVDAVVVGIGITPGTALAEAAGLEIENGIAVDAEGRTSDPAIWSAGDCASFPWRGRRIRLESVQNAIDQAEAAAQNMLGAGTPYDPMPWFWSDQFDTKLQIVGLGGGHDRVVVRNGAGLSHWYFSGDTLLSVEAMNDPRAYMVGKRLLEAGRSPAPDAVADPSTDLKTLMA
ncbi:FAD-dependent oxidoreductase [Roseicyclus sp. F158]|uniref:FAD-dependent oxidoreductase n=1 Tax=Tropicimonas omnivorans TaxID=3075590 RepID=A0ABU3DCD0_9RHOB|nr:FAD-dependent oxidoreductase [Roseicyclus sp. F158]MDT0681366.1 FAD-dependent oxidoreductase [Roseicyclus sp. F158]